VAIAIAEGLEEPLSRVADWIGSVSGSVNQWVQNNGALIASIVAGIAAFTAIGATLVVLGTLIGGFGSLLGFLATMWGVVSGAATMAMSVMGAGLALLMSPIGLLVAGFALIAAAAIYMSGVIGKTMKSVGEITSKTFGAIKAALAGGDIQLAAKILWLGLKMVWTSGVNNIKEIWYGFQAVFFDAWEATVGKVTEIWRAAVAWISKGVGWIMEKIGMIEDLEQFNKIIDEGVARENQADKKARAEKKRAREAALQEALAADKAAMEALEQERKKLHGMAHAERVEMIEEEKAKELEKAEGVAAAANGAKIGAGPKDSLVGGLAASSAAAYQAFYKNRNRTDEKIEKGITKLNAHLDNPKLAIGVLGVQDSLAPGGPA